MKQKPRFGNSRFGYILKIKYGDTTQILDVGYSTPEEDLELLYEFPPFATIGFTGETETVDFLVFISLPNREFIPGIYEANLILGVEGP